MSKITIGIDPGPRESAVLAWNGKKVVWVVDVSNPCLRSVIHTYSEVAIEWVECFGMAVGREVFETVFAIGQFSARCNPRLIPRRDVKMHLCCSMQAKDKNIRQALIDRFGPVGTKKNPGPLFGISKHRWAALAVAVTAFDLSETKNEAFFHKAKEQV